MPLSERDLQRLLDEEPFVRDLARQLVAGEADEVVQRTWLRAVQQGGAGIERPRHWLARILRNVVANLRRDHRRQALHEAAAAIPDLVPSSQELAQREESRRALVAAVDALPTTLRTVVLLRWFDGKPPRQIAEALGVPAATVSTQLQRALVLLRQRLDADHGGSRRAWMVPMVPFALRPELSPALPALSVVGASVAPHVVLGAIAMTSKLKLAAAAALALAIGAWFSLSDPMPPATPPSGSASAAAVQPQRGSLGMAATDAAPAAGLERDVATASTAATAAHSGTVVARVRRHDGTPAVGAGLALRERGGDALFGGVRQRTDANGTARFEAVPPGRLLVDYELSWQRQGFDLASGQTVEVELQLEAGLEVRGIVLDADKKAVAGALVELAMMARGDAFPELVAVTGADGRFVVRDCPTLCLVGARASGYVASHVRFLQGKEGNTAEVELVLGRDGGAVRGAVVDPLGKPVAGAVVIVGAGEVVGIAGRDSIPPFAGLTRSDERGEFSVVGLVAGTQPIRVRGGRFAPWRGEVDVAAGTTVVQRVELGPGATLRGRVVDGTGKPVARADIEIGEWGDIAHFDTASNAEGAFEILGLPVGEVVVRAEHHDLGKARATVVATASAVASCTLELSRGRELRGRVVDPDGQPIPAATIECMSEGAHPDRWSALAHSDAQGRFVAANRPEQGKVTLEVHATGYEARLVRGVDPNEEAVVQLQRMPPASVRITGRIVDPEGRPVANAVAHGFRRGGRGGSPHNVTDNDGRFELGPLAPGDWAVHVSATGHPDVRRDPHPLAADATWDLGTITLQRGGTARVRPVGAPIDGARFFVSNAARTQTYGVVTASDGKRTEVLAAGDYALLVAGEAVAAAAVPFTIRVGEDVVVDVPIERADPQTFRCEVPAGAAVDSVTLQLFRGDAFVGRVWVDGARAEPSAGFGLAPGEYRAVAEVGALRGSATFVVGAVSGPPVTVVLR